MTSFDRICLLLQKDDLLVVVASLRWPDSVVSVQSVALGRSRRTWRSISDW